MPRVHINHGKPPRNVTIPLSIKFACGWTSKHSFTANQLRWTLTGDAWDISNYWRIDRKDTEQ